MKFLDILSEQSAELDAQMKSHFDENKKRLEKKARIVYKALQNGTIRFHDKENMLVEFRWELPDEMEISPNPNIIRKGFIAVDAKLIKIYSLNYYTNNKSEIGLLELIRYKFKSYNVVLSLWGRSQHQFIRYKAETVNEENEPSITDGVVKKAKAIHTVFKNGFTNVQLRDREGLKSRKYRYKLPDEYLLKKADFGPLVTFSAGYDQKKGGFLHPCQVWRIEEDGKEKNLNRFLANYEILDLIQGTTVHSGEGMEFTWVIANISKKYRSYGLNIRFEI